MRKALGSRRRIRPGLRRALRRLACLALVAVVLGALHQAGSRFFYCEMMQSLETEPCCAPPSVAASASVEVHETPDPCCAEGHFSLLPVVQRPAATRVTERPVLAQLPAAPVSVARSFAPLRLRCAPPLTGPPPTPDASEARARSMVFLT